MKTYIYLNIPIILLSIAYSVVITYHTIVDPTLYFSSYILYLIPAAYNLCFHLILDLIFVNNNTRHNSRNALKTKILLQATSIPVQMYLIGIIFDPLIGGYWFIIFILYTCYCVFKAFFSILDYSDANRFRK